MKELFSDGETIKKATEIIKDKGGAPKHTENCCGDHASHTHLGCCSENKQEPEENVCELCGGKDGEHEDISTMEAVYPGEPHMADVGSRPCPNLEANEEDHDA